MKNLKKKTRHKAGWAIKNRYCALCRKWIPIDKALYQHHISYGDTDYSRKKNVPHPTRKKDITKNVCYICDCLIHCRLRFMPPYEKKYGKDFGAVALAFDILSMYKPVLSEALHYIKEVDNRK